MNTRKWHSRILIGTVLLINVQSAFVFLIFPDRFAPAYEVSGIPGQAVIRGFSILFLMWNVPYVTALLNPIKYRISLYEAIIMQGIGLMGESLILWSIPPEYTILRGSILRFIVFDGAGLIALASAAWITKSMTDAKSNSNILNNVF